MSATNRLWVTGLVSWVVALSCGLMTDPPKSPWDAVKQANLTCEDVIRNTVVDPPNQVIRNARKACLILLTEPLAKSVGLYGGKQEKGHEEESGQ